MTPEEFEATFNSRTLAYSPEYRSDARPVVVSFGDAADSAPGHLLMVSLANLLARAHRRIVFVGDLDRPLRCFDHFRLGSLREGTVGLARAVNSMIDASGAAEIPDEEILINIGVGASAELTVGCDGWIAHLSGDSRVGDDQTSLLGASLGACLAAGTAFHRALGHRGLPSGAYSLWDDTRISGAQGPDLSAPVDVGRVLQIGAGAVGCATDYWLGFLGLEGGWVVLDGDEVDVSNLNRQLLFVARHAGYPSGQPVMKADAAAGRIEGLVSHPHWYDAVESADVRAQQFDVVLPLANERGIRGLVHARPQGIYLHATTSPNWSALLHRHVAGVDDCIVCRLPEEDDAVFTCSTGKVGEKKRVDASLPFLSGLAGLLLVGALIRLQLGELVTRSENFLSVGLHAVEPIVNAYQWTCREGCGVWLPEPAREALDQGRFANLAKP